MDKKKRKIRKYVIIIFVLLLLITGYFYIQKNVKKVATSMQDAYVSEGTVERGNIEVVLTGSGVVEPISRVEIPKTVTGEVKTDNFKEGDTVKKDSVLFKIGSTTIKSPVRGTLITKNAEKGDYVTGATAGVGTTGGTTAAEPLAVIADISKMQVKIEVDEMDIEKVKLGLNAEITCDAVSGKTYEGVVSKIAAEGKTGNGVTTFDVTIQIENPEGLRIGMNTDVTLTIEGKENVLKLPMEAVNKNKQETYVYVKDENSNPEEEKQSIMLKAPTVMAEIKGYKKVPVEVGIYNKDDIEIISGLEDGDKVFFLNTSKTLTEYMMTSAGSMSTQNGK